MVTLVSTDDYREQMVVLGIVVSKCCLVCDILTLFLSEHFTKVLQEQQQDRAKREQERIRLLTSDPFDLEAQAKIEEDIRYSMGLGCTLMCCDLVSEIKMCHKPFQGYKINIHHS